MFCEYDFLCYVYNHEFIIKFSNYFTVIVVVKVQSNTPRKTMAYIDNTTHHF